MGEERFFFEELVLFLHVIVEWPEGVPYRCVIHCHPPPIEGSFSSPGHLNRDFPVKYIVPGFEGQVGIKSEYRANSMAASHRRNRPTGRQMTAPPRRGHVAAWGAMIGPGTMCPAPSMMPVTDRKIAV